VGDAAELELEVVEVLAACVPVDAFVVCFVVCSAVDVALVVPPMVETPGGTVPPGQVLGGDAVLAWTSFTKVVSIGRPLKQPTTKGSITYGACIIRVSQGCSQTFPIAESQPNIVRCAAPDERIHVKIPAGISAGSSGG
jgi:hypothetical protein